MIKVIIVEDIREMSRPPFSLIHEDGDIECVANISSSSVRPEDIIPSIPSDIVILNIGHNYESSLELIRFLRGISYRSQFLICTESHDSRMVFEFLKAGAMGYILKHATAAEIRQNIRDLFNGGSPMSPEIARCLVNSFMQKTALESRLSQREKEILELISDGMTYKAVSNRLFISPATVRNHLHNIYEKFQVSNKTQAINKFMRSSY